MVIAAQLALELRAQHILNVPHLENVFDCLKREEWIVWNVHKLVLQTVILNQFQFHFICPLDFPFKTDSSCESAQYEEIVQIRNSFVTVCLCKVA